MNHSVDIEAVIAALGDHYSPDEAAIIERMLREYPCHPPPWEMIWPRDGKRPPDRGQSGGLAVLRAGQVPTLRAAERSLGVPGKAHR